MSKKNVQELLEEALVPIEEQPYEIPENWVWVRLGYASFIYSGNAFPKKYQEIISKPIPFFKVGDLSNVDNAYQLHYSNHTVDMDIVNAIKAKVIPEDVIIFAKIGEAIKLNRRALTIKESCIDNNLMGIKSNYIMNNSYLLKWTIKEDFYKYSKASTIPSIRKTIIEKLAIPLPPLSEQKRIANKIDSLFAKLDRASDLLREIKNRYDLRIVSLFEYSYKGMLNTNKSNEDKLKLERTNESIVKSTEIPNNWVAVELGEIVSFIGGGTPSKNKKEYWNGDIPWATVKDIKGRSLERTQDYITNEGKQNSSTTIAHSGELLLITRMAPGKSIISTIKTAINQDLKIVRINHSQIHNEFLWIYFEANKRFIEAKATGSTVKGIQIKKLQKLIIYLPPFEEQLRIATRVKSILNKLDQEYFYLNEIRQNIETLKKSILNKAFRGQLGTNNPSEESALELLQETLQQKLNK